MKEEWRRIKDYPDYLVSDRGQVFNKESRKFLKQRKNQRGYLCVSLIKDGKQRAKSVHLLVAEAFCENIANSIKAVFIDGDKSNVCARNLMWCFEHDLSKLREIDIQRIRRYMQIGSTYTRLAKGFKVSAITIEKIIKGHYFDWLPFVVVDFRRPPLKNNV